MVAPGRDEVKREAERGGPVRVFKAAGADWRERAARCASR